MTIDRRYQGQGIGSSALRLLLQQLQQEGQFTEVILSVNCCNPAAIAAYKKIGFEDSGQLFYGGKSGPQHVLAYYLDNV